ncbi:MAG TPA: helix-turn-helix transcriptional regulator [Alcanivoracaceae bacterium]|nr:helix-turn-helix transcriptional regulator [Alcanivoracaceae bacterium]
MSLHKTIPHMELGLLLKHYRERLGATLEEVAYRAGTDASNLSRIERGLQQPSVQVLENIAQALQVQLSEVFKRLENPYEITEGEEKWGQQGVLLLRILSKLEEDDQELIVDFARMIKARAAKSK